MTPVQILLTAISTAVGADAAKLAGDVSVCLMTNAFAPGPDTTFIGANEATFDGYAPIVKTAATRPTAFDPATGDRILTIPPPAGGWIWETTGPTNLPQTITGFAVYTGAAGMAGTLLACQRLPSNVVLTAADQQVSINDPMLRFLVGGVL